MKAIWHSLFYLSALTVAGLLLFPSCKKSPLPPVAAIDESYFPLITGKYIIYDVDSTIYSNFFDSTFNYSYQVMEMIDSAYPDAGGDTAYRIIRSMRKDENHPWVVQDIWSASLTDHTAEKVEENLRFIKLDFPVSLNKTWKGNSLVSTDSSLIYLKDWNYTYTEVNTSLTIGATVYDSVVTVTQHDDENAIEKIIYLEKYAKNIGLIYKQEQDIETQPGEYDNGFLITMSIHEHN